MSPDPHEPPPPWASILNAGQYRRFIDAVEHYFVDRSVPARLRDGFVHLNGPDGAEQLGLTNLAQLCAHVPPDNWPDVIAQHFDNLRDRTSAKALLGSDEIFENVREALALRIYPPDISREVKQKIVCRHDMADALTVLCIDLPQTIQTVPRSSFERWGRGQADIFELALAHTRQMGRPTINEVDVGEGQTVYLASGESFFTATWALMLEELDHAASPHGALVGTPSRHYVVYAPIHDVRVVTAIGPMLNLLLNVHREGPGSISPALYWRRDGRFVQLPYDINEERVDFTPPEEFVEMLNGLAE